MDEAQQPAVDSCVDRLIMGDWTTVSGVQKAGETLGRTAFAADGFTETFDPKPNPLRDEAHREGRRSPLAAGATGRNNDRSRFSARR
jgi:hypothetical protein